MPENNFHKLLLVITAICAVGYFGVRKIRNTPSVNTVEYANILPAVAGQDPAAACRAKQTCLIMYVAPWCPACHSFLQNHYQQVKTAAANKDVGFLVVVGADEEMKVREMGKTLGALATLDLDGEFRAKNKVGFFPLFIVTERSKVVHHGKRAIDWMNDELMR